MCGAVAMLAGCAPSAATGSIPSRPQPLAARPPATAGVGRLPEPELHASLIAPSRAPYDVDLLGIGTQFVGIRLTNSGDRVAVLGRLRATFTATREGVPFPCNDRHRVVGQEREPASLGPGESFVFDRALDCSMPLPGRYEVGVSVALGERASGRGDPIGAFSLEVVGGTTTPRPYPARPGLYFAMIGGRVTSPLPPEAWRRGDYHVVVAVVNAGPGPIPVGPARLTMETYRVGSPFPCSGQADPLAFPDRLEAGGVHTLQAPVTCSPSEEGHYVLVGRLALGAVGSEIEIGRVPLAVSHDPLPFVSDPLDVHPERGDSVWVP